MSPSHASSRRIQQSTLERAFSGVYSLPGIGRLEARAASNRAVWRVRLVAFILPEGARPEARAASNRAVWRERLMSFTVFRRVRAPKRERHPTELECSGGCAPRSARGNRAIWKVRLVAFIESSGGCAPRRARGIQQSSLERKPVERVRIVEFEQPRDCV